MSARTDDLDWLYPDERPILFVGRTVAYRRWKDGLLPVGVFLPESLIVCANKILRRSQFVARTKDVQGRHNCIVVRGYGWEEVVDREPGLEDALTAASAGSPQLYVEDDGGVTYPRKPGIADYLRDGSAFTHLRPLSDTELKELFKPFTPVTDQEMAEVYASLGIEPAQRQDP